MNKLSLFLLALTVIIVTSVIIIMSDKRTDKPSKSEVSTAINQAGYFYNQQKQRGESFSSGPCLSDALMEDWVADLVHSPRELSDDLPQNQCSSYLEGRAKHIVELDLDGNFVRAK
jgi:hypothetical protein